MPPYIPIPFEVEPINLAGQSYDYLEGKIPGWLPSPGNLEAWLIESQALIAGELRALTALVPEAIFRYFGSTILGLPPLPATQAHATTTWHAVDAAGYTVNAGAVIAIVPPASTIGYAFTVDADFTIPAGQTTALGIGCTALDAGAAASGQTGTVQVIDPLSFIANVTLDTATSGGQDAETDDDYRNRLSALLTLLTPRPILAPDFAVLAEREIAGVARATAIDLYNPGPPVVTNCPRCVTVAVVDDAGKPVSPEVKAEVDALLQAAREVNFLVFVVDPTYTMIDVTVSATCYSVYDPSVVQASITAALTAYLSPGNWGLPPFGDTSARSWINQTKVRYLELTEVVNRVDGVHYVNSLTFRVAGGTMAIADLTLAGVAPLPLAGAITATVTAET